VDGDTVARDDPEFRARVAEYLRRRVYQPIDAGTDDGDTEAQRKHGTLGPGLFAGGDHVHGASGDVAPRRVHPARHEHTSRHPASLDLVSERGTKRTVAEQVRGQLATVKQADRLDQHIRALVATETSGEGQTRRPQPVAGCRA